MTVRKNEPQAERFFKQVLESLPEVEREVRTELQYWEYDGRPRVGFRQEDVRYFRAPGDEDEFRKAVLWVREHLNLLVSTLHPRLQRMLADER